MRSKIVLAVIFVLVVGDAFLLHGRYRQSFMLKAEVAEQRVADQKWSSPMLN
jgi:hypothetical protein